MEATLTPMMKQYLDIKKRHKDDILFFRMGDFYEMFFEDAEVASAALDIALTSRQNSVPMCGVPYHAAESYIARLIKAGFRVAICEQTEAQPSSGSIVKREVVRIITPGTVLESNLLQSDDNNFLASAVFSGGNTAMAFVDISTGDFYLTEIKSEQDVLRGEIARFNPREIVLKKDCADIPPFFKEYIKQKGISVYQVNSWTYDHDYMADIVTGVYGTCGVKGLGLNTENLLLACGSILYYIQETQRQMISHLSNPQISSASDKMVLDDATIINLELVENQQDYSRNRTLFSVLNLTKTAMGKRMLERSILEPLLSKAEIEERLDSVEYLMANSGFMNEIRDILARIADVERLVSRLSLIKTNPRNFIAINNSLKAIADVDRLIRSQSESALSAVMAPITDLGPLCSRINSAITDEPAVSPENGRVIREGFLEELDRLYSIKQNGKQWIIEYQEEERRRLQISTLKVKYNRVLGYYIEVSKGQTQNVPAEYQRKQTLVSAERYTTEKLKEFETDILSADEKIVGIEKNEIEKLRNDVLERQKDIQHNARWAGRVDFLQSLASSALENRFVRPVIDENGTMDIRDGRHPVVEKYYTKEPFVPNDINFDSDENIIRIITGPNMSGKSTYIRMCAIIQLMAQTGSYVPATSARIPVVDRIFTRIGASDNISRGESTFLVEMNETAAILNNATNKSLIIMDEVGRGTSTYDGLSIAWAVVEYILRYLKAKTMFATHYHELVKLGSKKGIVNYNVMVNERIDGVDFLHRVIPGSADKSYGIHVAKLAGIPRQIVSRANEIQERLENGAKTFNNSTDDSNSASEQLQIFNAANHVVIQAVRSIDTDKITPLDALNELNRLKKLID